MKNSETFNIFLILKLDYLLNRRLQNLNLDIFILHELPFKLMIPRIKF